MAKWIIDTQHSDVHFKARYMIVASVTGEFRKFEGTAETASDDDFTNASIRFVADTNTIDTNNEKRDEHLREDDFFNVIKFPQMIFESAGFRHVKDNDYKLNGHLTIKGVTHPIELDVIAGGTATDPQGKQRVGFEVSGRLNRWDYGLMWTLLTEAGAIILGEEVKIHANVQLIRE